MSSLTALGGATALALALVLPAQAAAGGRVATTAGTRGAPAAARHMNLNCGNGYRSKYDTPTATIQCPDVFNPVAAFGHYVGHDEPGVWFDSSVPGSGNHARWQLTLPTDPAPSSVPGAKIYSFEQHVAFWFGMALCASQSFPEQVSTCKPDSDSNIVNPKTSPTHSGSAYLELQFYPPGSTAMPSGISCNAAQWCAAMNVWSYYQDPVTGKFLNSTCQAKVGGSELDNFAFVTRNGKPVGPPNPLTATSATFTPNANVLYMNQGDKVGVTIEDSRAGLTVRLDDHTSHRSGTMTASAANGFAQMVFAPDPSTQCSSTPYTFRPMYSTSSIQTRATWTAFPYNIAWSDETGHFDYCSQVDTSTGKCTGDEGAGANKEPADSDDFECFPASAATRDPVGGCIAPNYGFDGPPYLKDWPNGSKSRPTPIMFSSPLTGRHFTVNYAHNALAAPLPFNEAGGGHQPSCDIYTATGCTKLPLTDDGTPAAFYPYFYTTRVAGCTWGEGTDVPGLTVRDFGKLNQYGTYDRNVYYTGTSGPYKYSSVFIKNYPRNECPAPRRESHS